MTARFTNTARAVNTAPGIRIMLRGLRLRTPTLPAALGAPARIDTGRPSPRHYKAKPAPGTLISATAGERAAEAMAGFRHGGRLVTLSLGQWDKNDWAEAMAGIIEAGKVERVRKPPPSEPAAVDRVQPARGDE